MASPEDILHRSRIVFVPEDKTGGDPNRLTGTESPQQKEPHSEAQQLFSSPQTNIQALQIDNFVNPRIQRRARWEKWEKTRKILEISDAQDKHKASTHTSSHEKHKPGEPVDLSNQPVSVNCVGRFLDTKGMEPTRDLTANAKWLFDVLVNAPIGRKRVARYAERDGIDLEAALEELDYYQLIDYSDPEWYDLTWQKIQPRW